MANVIRFLPTYFCIPKNFDFGCSGVSSAEGRHTPGNTPVLDLYTAFIPIWAVHAYIHEFAWQARLHSLDYVCRKDEKWSLCVSFSISIKVRERKYLYFLSLDTDFCLQQKQESSPDHKSSPSSQDYTSILSLCIGCISIFHYINDCLPQ